MKDLSPAAQAVRDAALATYDKSIPKDDSLWALDRASVVAALRAAAEKIEDLYCESNVDDSDGVVFALRQLMLLADELEGKE